MDPKVILETALNREEITAIESLILLESGREIDEQLFHVADQLNQRINHNVVTYLKAKRLIYTTLCTEHCTRCSFHDGRSRKDPFTLPPEKAASRLKDMSGIREISLKGGLNPNLNVTYHLRLLRGIKEAYPDVNLNGYSPNEIRFIAKRTRTTPYDILRRFRDAGLDSIPGESADILNDKLRKKLSPDQIKTHEWIDMIKTAHRLGISTSATILVGHSENNIHISEHLDIIKNIQKETGGFTSFRPIPYLSSDGHRRRQASPDKKDVMEILLRIHAITRIVYHRLIKNSEIDLQVCGVPVAMTGLAAGANDLGALIQQTYPELHAHADTFNPTAIRNGIIKAGRIPIERTPYRLKSGVSKTPDRAMPAALQQKSYARPWPAQAKPPRQPDPYAVSHNS